MIPEEILASDFWLAWRTEWVTKKDGTQAPTKVPYNPIKGERCDVKDESCWLPYAKVYDVLHRHPDYYSGFGFALCDYHLYSTIDLDNPWKYKNKPLDPNVPEEKAQAEATWRGHCEIVNEFDSYTEWSPSNTGLHIWVRGKLPVGARNRSGNVEVYSRDRFLTVTGRPYGNDVKPLQTAEVKLLQLSQRLAEVSGSDSKSDIAFESQPQTAEDNVILKFCAEDRRTGELFLRLWAGDGGGYGSGSEGDQALANCITKYTQNFEQAERIFKASGWYATREKLHGKRADYLIGRVLKNGYDKQVPNVDFSALQARIATTLRERAEGAAEPASTAVQAQPAPIAPSLPYEPDVNRYAIDTRPPGLLGDITDFIEDNAASPSREIALGGAIAMMGGICGKAWNFAGNGLNQYVIVLADSGRGKDAIPSGMSRLLGAVETSGHLSAFQFMGPQGIASGQALYRRMSEPGKSSFVSYLPEFGHLLHAVTDSRAGPIERGFMRSILDIWSKSFHGARVEGAVYSDKDKNTEPVKSPALSFVGDSTPDTFYESVTAKLVEDGLVPRLLILTADRYKPRTNPRANRAPIPQQLVDYLTSLITHSQSQIANDTVIQCEYGEGVADYLEQFSEYCRTQYNEHSPTQAHKAIWSRVHQKCLKLAGLCAVGVNPFHPVVTMQCVAWARSFVLSDVQLLVNRFDTGEQDTNAPTTDRENFVLSAIKRYLHDPKVIHTYKLNAKLHAAGLVEYSYLSRVTASKAHFRKAQGGATRALKETIENLKQMGVLSEVPPMQVFQLTDGGKMVCYDITDRRPVDAAAVQCHGNFRGDAPPR